MRVRLAHRQVVQGRHLSPLFLLQLGGPATHPTTRWAASYFGEEAGAREASLEGADGYCTFVLSLALF